MENQTPPGSPDDLTQLIAYLRQHSGQYNMDALRSQLLASGHNPALVERAITEVRGAQPEKSNKPIWPQVALVVVGNMVGVPIISTIFAWLASNFSSADWPFLLALLIGPAVVLGELIWGIVIMNGPKARMGRILLFGAIFSIIVPFALGALLFGICLVVLGGLSYQ